MVKKIALSYGMLPVRMASIYLMLAMLLSACAPGAIPQTGAQLPDSIEIGAVVPLTGRYGAGGEQVKNGYELAVDDINKAG
ncbi:MAG: hypothetical protein EHM70_25160, partial [Chloroflexota bacterium]